MRHIAILIDGGYFLKRLPAWCDSRAINDPKAAKKHLSKLIFNHLKALHPEQECKERAIWATLYRSFYYDAKPFMDRGHSLKDKRAVDYSKTPDAIFRLELFDLLRKMPSMALRLGEVHMGGWQIKPRAFDALLAGERQFSELSDEDFSRDFRQKGVDMRLGMDLTALAFKKQIDTVVIVTGDADFVPVAKLARREGIRIILDPLWRNVSDELHEHVDGVTSGLAKPGQN